MNRLSLLFTQKNDEYTQEKVIHEKREGKGSAPEERPLHKMVVNDFEATFSTELIPGILHNFANPLNGIMGRAQILQRRLQDTVAKIHEQYPDAAAAFLESHKKLVSDVASICQESERFYGMFQDVSGKFYALGSANMERINLSRLLAAELRFADYYLDFKNQVQKELDLGDDLPEIRGISGHYSLCFWSLFRSAVERMKDSVEKTLYLSTAHDQRAVTVRLHYRGRPWTEEERRIVEHVLATGDWKPTNGGHLLSRFCLGLSLLRQLGAQIECDERNGQHEIVIRVAYGS